MKAHEVLGDTSRRTLSVKGHHGIAAMMIVIVYRGVAWVSIGPSFTGEATLEYVPIDSLVDALIQAVKQARGDTKP